MKKILIVLVIFLCCGCSFINNKPNEEHKEKHEEIIEEETEEKFEYIDDNNTPI